MKQENHLFVAGNDFDLRPKTIEFKDIIPLGTHSRPTKRTIQ